MATLELWNGAQRVAVFDLGPGRHVVGRAEGSDVFLPCEQISRCHCFVEGSPDGGWHVVDVSTNGTGHNGTRLPRRIPHPLAHGDVLELGPFRLILHLHDPPRQAVPTQREIPFASAAPPTPRGHRGPLVGVSRAMQRVGQRIRKLAAADVAVLVRGESGTGKELVARALHDQGPRARGPFVPVNAAALRDTLIESELFGHEKGAFTGADARRDGAFHHADGGTLFLDEIGELRPDVQASLLRVLEGGEVRRIGSAQVEHPDVRVVAATHRDLDAMCARETFRHDLVHRLAVSTIRLPPLRERRCDIPALVDALLDAHHPGVEVSPEALGCLIGHDWPGNVRELRNRLLSAVLEADGPGIGPEHVDLPKPDPRILRDDTELLRVIAARTGALRTAARALGTARNTLRHWFRKHGIPVPCGAT